MPDDIALYLGGTFSDPHRAVSISNMGVQSIAELESALEEADAWLILHVAYSVRCGSESVVVCASDTDVALCIHYAHKIIGLKEMWIWKSSSEFIPAHAISSSLGPRIVSVLLAEHAVTFIDWL